MLNESPVIYENIKLYCCIMSRPVFLFVLLATLVISGCASGQSRPNQHPGLVDCRNDYNCLFQQSLQGHSAKIVIAEEVKSLSLKEISEIRVKPVNHRFQVSMKILDLEKISWQSPRTRSIIGAVSKTCPQIVNNLDKIKSREAVCLVNSIEELRELVFQGLTEKSIRKYNCQGDLIDSIRNICVTPAHPLFPPGIKKPAVYLYPQKASKIKVKLDLKGHITQAEPDYLSGWEVTVQPCGLIDNRYDYLFYEARLTRLQLPSEGWVVKFPRLESWFDQTLPLLGLREKEIMQFKEYWLKELPPADYYEIRLLSDDFLKENMDLIIDPKPDTIIRLDFYFRAHDHQIKLEKPIVKTPQRQGFTVVEWGGLLDNRHDLR